METKVVFMPKTGGLKNPKLSIIQFLLQKGVFVDTIQCSQQELMFVSNESAENPDEHWSQELNKFFKGQIDFKAKRPA